jgi:hypothetical protein
MRKCINSFFSPDFPREAIPNFQKELMHFRMMPDGKELVLETLLEFRHFETASDTALKDNLGAPPPLGPNEDRAASSGNVDDDEHVSAHGTEGGTRRGAVDTTVSENSNKRTQKQLKYSQIRWIGEFCFVLSSFIRICSSYLYPFFRRLGILLIVLSRSFALFRKIYNQVTSPRYILRTQRRMMLSKTRRSAWRYSKCPAGRTTCCTT